jgi:hypothetical protein
MRDEYAVLAEFPDMMTYKERQILVNLISIGIVIFSSGRRIGKLIINKVV